MRDIFNKIFCLHDWDLNHETLTQWTEKKVTEDTRTHTFFSDLPHKKECRVYICQKCGKIKTVNISL